MAHERHKHLEYVEAGGIIDFYIGDAIKDTPDKIKLLRRRSILEDFEKACPEGVTDNSYNGDLLEHWIREPQ